MEQIYSKEKAQAVREFIGNKLEKGPELMLEYLSKNVVETFAENEKRVEDCKKYLKYDVPFVCVSHSRTINQLSGKFIKNCEGIEV